MARAPRLASSPSSLRTSFIEAHFQLKKQSVSKALTEYVS